jgi:hypothetical protein
MNTERIKELAKQAGDDWDHTLESDKEFLKKFAELIVRECINQAHSVGDLRGANDDVIYGADTAAVKISKHFGVEGVDDGKEAVVQRDC